MQLWAQWWWCVQTLRPACPRRRTFVAMVLVLVGLPVRSDLAGVTSFVRAVGLRPQVYRRLLHLFHSDGVDLQALTKLWCLLALKPFAPLRVGGRMLCLADGLKAAKEGKKCPASKSATRSRKIIPNPSTLWGIRSKRYRCSPRGPRSALSRSSSFPVAKLRTVQYNYSREKRKLLSKPTKMSCARSVAMS